MSRWRVETRALKHPGKPQYEFDHVHTVPYQSALSSVRDDSTELRILYPYDDTGNLAVARLKPGGGGPGLDPEALVLVPAFPWLFVLLALLWLLRASRLAVCLGQIGNVENPSPGWSRSYLQYVCFVSSSAGHHTPSSNPGFLNG